MSHQVYECWSGLESREEAETQPHMPIIAASVREAAISYSQNQNQHQHPNFRLMQVTVQDEAGAWWDVWVNHHFKADRPEPITEQDWINAAKAAAEDDVEIARRAKEQGY